MSAGTDLVVKMKGRVGGPIFVLAKRSGWKRPMFHRFETWHDALWFVAGLSGDTSFEPAATAAGNTGGREKGASM